MTESSWLSALIGATFYVITFAFAAVVIARRRPVGVSLAWLVLLFTLPLAGIFLYILFGTPRLGTARLRRMHHLFPSYAQWTGHLRSLISDREPHNCPVTPHTALYALAEKNINIPLLPGNRLQLFSGFDAIFDQLLQDIQQAQRSVVLEFYIWEAEGRAQTVAEALIDAAQRGIECTVVLDNVGSRQFLQGQWVSVFYENDISVTASMSVGPLGMAFERMDIRNHRKILVVDDNIAWTGSFNLVDPRLFKQSAQVGQWVDAMVRIEGVAAHVMGSLVMLDKALEERQSDSQLVLNNSWGGDYQADGDAVHILPSGPDVDRQLLHQMLLTAIYQSRETLLLSTPYFVPDESLLTALKSAAMRGVDVQLLVPAKNDSKMVHHASRSYYEDLLEAGVTILQFHGGLLHTKCVLVDGQTALFGTVNLDMRSVWLNYELTLVIYSRGFGKQIEQLMAGYREQAEPVEVERWLNRGWRLKLLENLFQLFSPLL